MFINAKISFCRVQLNLLSNVKVYSYKPADFGKCVYSLHTSSLNKPALLKKRSCKTKTDGHLAVIERNRVIWKTVLVSGRFHN